MKLERIVAMRCFAIAMFLAACHVSLAATLTVVSPADKAVVPLLSADQKAYLDMGRAERRARFDAVIELPSHG